MTWRDASAGLSGGAMTVTCIAAAVKIFGMRAYDMSVLDDASNTLRGTARGTGKDMIDSAACS